MFSTPSEFSTPRSRRSRQELRTFDVLDSRELVPYQCLVRRSEWEDRAWGTMTVGCWCRDRDWGPGGNGIHRFSG